MHAQLSEAPDGTPPSTIPVQIAQRTMGGLPILPGAVRHGGEVIVPLDASHFLAISTMDVGGDFSHTWLAETVMAADPNAGKPASSQVQTETIRRVAVRFGAIRDCGTHDGPDATAGPACP
jgi:hypothetical protein